MGISLDQLPYDSATVYTDRWLFQLSDELRGPHGGANFDLGVVIDPVDTRVLRRFICAHGKAMVGALRVVGEPCELGDCSALKPKSDQIEPEPTLSADAPADQSQPPEPTLSADAPADQSQPPEPALALDGKSGETGSVAPENVTAPGSNEEPAKQSQRPSSAVDSVRPSQRPSAFDSSPFDPLSGLSRAKGKPSK